MLPLVTTSLIAVGLFVGASDQTRVLRLLGPSTVAHEDAPEVVSHSIACFFKALNFATLAYRALWWPDGTRDLELGVCFACFELCDLLYMRRHPRTASLEHLVHHLVHLVGVLPMILWGDAEVLRIGVRLLTQEVSGIFLNPYLMLRHRGRPILSNALLCAFVVTFFRTRVMNTSRLVYEHRRRPVAIFLFPALMLQLRWFGAILSKVWARLSNAVDISFGRGRVSGSIDPDAGAPLRHPHGAQVVIREDRPLPRRPGRHDPRDPLHGRGAA